MKKVIERSGRGAAYGKQILATVSQGLTAECGDGFDYTALTRLARFAELMTDGAIVVTLSQQFGIAGEVVA
jgi:hypothetical protein